MYDGGNLHDLEHSRRFGEHLESMEMETPTELGNVAFIGEWDGLAMLLRCLVLFYIIISFLRNKGYGLMPLDEGLYDTR